MECKVVIDPNDPVYAFMEAMEGVNLEQYFPPIRSNNSLAHDRTMLLKAVLFAFSQGVFSTREIADKCRTDVRLMWLTDYRYPSHQAFERMFQLLELSVDDLFFKLSHRIAFDLMAADPDLQFVDGTKIEANANKNSFVYRKRIVNNREKLYPAISEDIRALNCAYGYDYQVQKVYDSKDLFYICQYLMEVMVQLGIEMCYGKGKHKTEIQRTYDTFLKYALKLQEYEYWLDIIGTRSSCSKTDHDATMMATKYDYYNQTGITRACYNCQVAVSDGIIVNSEVYQTPGDTKTWIPFMERYHDWTGRYPENPVADAGYGSYDNYFYNVEHGIRLVQKYNYYGKTKDPKFRKRIYNQENWKKDEEDFLVCPAGRSFSEYQGEKLQTTDRGNPRIIQYYSEPRHCEGCSRKEECTKTLTFRRLGQDVILKEFREEVDRNLGGAEGKEMRRQRSIQVEGAFGVIKQDFKFTRFTRRGLKGVRMEFFLVCLGYNLRKFYIFKNKQRSAGAVSVLC